MTVTFSYDSIRATLGKDTLKNAIHAPLDEEKAKEEIMLAFGDELEFDEDGKVKEPSQEGVYIFTIGKYTDKVL